MTSAAPAVLALETDSAWVVIVAVSLVTLAAALILRRLINRPGGVLSGVLLSLPLVLPLVAALVYEHALLPEVAVLRPAGSALLDRSGDFLHLLLFQDQRTHAVTPYALTGSAGPWILLAGALVTSFMLLRRVVGVVLVRRLIGRCRPPAEDDLAVRGPALDGVDQLSSLPRRPEVLVLPDGVQGAFAAGGGKKGKILISEGVIYDLDREELEGILAHEVAHLETHDVSVVFAAGLLRDLVAWNPLAHLAFRRLASDREREADRRAAILTARPLAVASGLLKMYDLMKTQSRAVDKGAMAFLRPGRQISRRVTDLIALADGRTLAAPSGRVPFLMAGLLVAVLGLQVGARVATQDMNGFAIVLGDTSSNNAEFWTPAEIRNSHKAVNGRHQVAARRPAAKKKSAAPSPRYPELTREVLVREKNLPAWFEWMARRAEGMSRSSLRWDLRREWKAVPVFRQPAGGPLTIYRLAPRGS